MKQGQGGGSAMVPVGACQAEENGNARRSFPSQRNRSVFLMQLKSPSSTSCAVSPNAMDEQLISELWPGRELGQRCC